jgi:hypothetical protein
VTIGPVGERLALEEAITRARARGVALASVRGDGIRDHLLRFIREFKSAAINAADLRQACSGLSDAAAKRVGEVAEIFAEYDNLLREARAADAHDRERRVVERLHQLEEAGQRPRFLNGVEHLLGHRGRNRLLEGRQCDRIHDLTAVATDAHADFVSGPRDRHSSNKRQLSEKIAQQGYLSQVKLRIRRAMLERLNRTTCAKLVE